MTALVLGGISPVLVVQTAHANPLQNRITWQKCATEFGGPSADGMAECGVVTVPIDWSTPAGEKVDIALARRPATNPSARRGALLLNPGGPGGEGVDDVIHRKTKFSERITSSFDIIGFDPRGVGLSHAIRCPKSAVYADTIHDPRTEDDFRRVTEDHRLLFSECRRLTGPLAEFVDAVSVARDMDAIRAALGEEQLSFHGISYGTLLGQRYAEMFPERVRTMVLDSNMDRTLSSAKEWMRSLARSNEEHFEKFVSWCRDTPRCPLHGRDVASVYATAYAKADAGELAAAHPRVRDRWEFTGLVERNLEDGSFMSLGQKLQRYVDGDNDLPFAGGRSDDYPYGIAQPFASIFCQDFNLPIGGFAEFDQYTRDVAVAAPNVKMSVRGWQGPVRCLGRQEPVRNPPHSWKPADPSRILMVNSRYDLATPYEWAVSSARQSGVTLLTYDGVGHYTYGRGGACVVDATDTFLLTGVSPAPGTRCPALS